MTTTECRTALSDMLQSNPGLTTPEIMRRTGWSREQVRSDLRHIGARMEFDADAKNPIKPEPGRCSVVRRMIIGSLFSGIGGLDVGLELAGCGETVWQVEQSEFCRAILARHWPNAKRYDDVRTVGAATLVPVDILCGGFPCQDISGAGAGAGLDGARSGLWFEMLRIIQEIRPRGVVIENVSRLVRRGLDVVVSGLTDAGYAVEATRIQAADLGAPHRRERILIVAVAHDHRERRQQGDRGERDEARRAESDDSGAASLADRDGARQLQSGWRVAEQWGRPGDGGKWDGLGDPRSPGLEELLGGSDHAGSTHDGTTPAVGAGGGPPEPGLGRAPDGIPPWMDHWPAGRGEEPYPWEAPRVTTERGKDRKHRLMALGNAVVPLVGYVAGRRLLDLLGAT